MHVFYLKTFFDWLMAGTVSSVWRITVTAGKIHEYRNDQNPAFKLVDVSVSCGNDQFPSGIDEEDERTPRKLPARDHSFTDDGNLIRRRRGDRSKEFTVAWCSFERGSNVTNISESQETKQNLPNTSTVARTWIVLNRLSRNTDSPIRCNFEGDSNVNDVSELQ
jgi:hypothetical protein